jgi:hypothetical protein
LVVTDETGVLEEGGCGCFVVVVDLPSLLPSVEPFDPSVVPPPDDPVFETNTPEDGCRYGGGGGGV